MKKRRPLPLDTDFWTDYFARNQRNRPEPLWQTPLDIPEKALPLLMRSIREFELGDGGGPAGLIAFNAADYQDQSPALRQVVDLWFNEEKEHSRLLGDMTQRLGATPITGHWSFSLFCLFRKWLGVAFELQILTVTELVSTAYYTLLRKQVRDPALRGVCALILRDEGGHVRFQNDRLAAAGRSRHGIRGKFWGAQFWISGYIAATVLWLSHGKCICALGGSTWAFYANVHLQIATFLEKLDVKALAYKDISHPAPHHPLDRVQSN